MNPFIVTSLNSDGSLFTVDTTNIESVVGSQGYSQNYAVATLSAIDSTDPYVSGARYREDGCLRLYDATAGLPSGVQYVGGVAFTSTGQMCITTDAVTDAIYISGMAVRQDGAVFAQPSSFYLPLADADAGDGAVDLTSYGAGDTTSTFTRATPATTINSAGLIVPVASGVARSYYDPTTLQYMGYLPEGARTNLVLNSLIDGTDFSTQSVNVTAVAHTLSFYGTGTITLSGASTAGPLVGTGVYPQRVSLTFTPSAASLTLTVAGSCKYVQLEVGAFASTFIPTAGSAVTRNADVLTFPSSGNVSGTVGTFYAEASIPTLSTTANQYFADLGNNRPPAYLNFASTTLSLFDGTAERAFVLMSAGSSKIATAWGGAASLGAFNGSTGSAGFDGDMDVGANMTIGAFLGGGSNNLFGTIKNVRIWKNQFTAAQLQAITA